MNKKSSMILVSPAATVTPLSLIHISGESCALCSDAGMPAVSDPGEVIVRDAHARGIPVVPGPAASAAGTALCVSGQPTGRFVFEGFLPTNRRQKKERLAALQNAVSYTHLDVYKRQAWA